MTMFIKSLLVYCAVFLLDFAHGQKDKKFFRDDYIYIEATEGFYKFHTSRLTWADAKQVCALEGASLFYPDNSDEANAVITLWKSNKPNIKWAFVGLSDIISEGMFETIDGKLVAEVYNQWQKGEPNDMGGNEDCVHLNVQGDLNDYPCDGKSHFICKKSLTTLEWNDQCKTSDLDYTFYDNGICYKLHNTPLNWMDAHAVCRAEQSYLAVIHNQMEAAYLVNLTALYSGLRVGGDYFRGIYHLGFHNRLHAGWQTVRGTPLIVEDKHWWDNYPPSGDVSEKCGSMFYTGRLNIINCDIKSLFICEREVEKVFSSTEMDPEIRTSTSKNRKERLRFLEYDPVLDA